MEALVEKRSMRTNAKGVSMFNSGFVELGEKQYRRKLADGSVYVSRKKPLRFADVSDARLVANYQRARGVPTRTIKTANGYVNLSRVGINPRWYMRNR